MIKLTTKLKLLFLTTLLVGFGFNLLHGNRLLALDNPQSGSIGLEGTITAAPPATGATITVPTNGQTFTNVPVTVAGLCPANVNVRIFRNNVFAGSVDCKNGSFSLQIDLFSGRNDLVARVYDSFEQAGPDSNTVTVFFNDGKGPGAGSRISLTTPYAKKGVDPGQTLTWPLVVSGGTPPYAISIDWGDGSALDLISQSVAGGFDISHKYANSGIYNVIIRGVDKDGVAAFLQVVAIVNGKPTATTEKADTKICGLDYRYLLYFPVLILVLAVATFWLGRKYELAVLRKKLQNMGPGGFRPF